MGKVIVDFVFPFQAFGGRTENIFYFLLAVLVVCLTLIVSEKRWNNSRLGLAIAGLQVILAIWLPIKGAAAFLGFSVLILIDERIRLYKKNESSV